MTGRYCFHRCLSFNISGGGTWSQIFGGDLVSDFREGYLVSDFFGGGYLVSDFQGGGYPVYGYMAGGMPLAFTQEDFLVIQ